MTSDAMHELHRRLDSKSDSYERLVDEHKKLAEEHRKLVQKCNELMRRHTMDHLTGDRPPYDEAIVAISAGVVKLIQIPPSQYDMHLAGVIFIRNLVWDIVDLSEEKEMEDIQRKESK